MLFKKRLKSNHHKLVQIGDTLGSMSIELHTPSATKGQFHQHFLRNLKAALASVELRSSFWQMVWRIECKSWICFKYNKIVPTLGVKIEVE